MPYNQETQTPFENSVGQGGSPRSDFPNEGVYQLSEKRNPLTKVLYT